MQIAHTTTMIAVIVLALVVAAVAAGRWRAPLWFFLVGALAAYPLSHTLMDRFAAGAPDGLLRSAFEVACSIVVTALLSPLYHRLRHGKAGRKPSPAPADVPRTPVSR